MTAKKQPPYAPLRVDRENEWVWCGEQRLKLTPKAFAVVHYLAEHAGKLVTKDQLLQVVWPDTVVSEWALASCIKEIRKALKDTPRAPQYIETVHRRGFRFIGKVASSQQAGDENQKAKGKGQKAKVDSHSAFRILHSTIGMVGRDPELAQLHQWLDKALSSERHIVFVTGEPGIGKTTLVEAFLQQAGDNGEIWIGRGQCIEHFGAGEAYLPVLEALGRLCREPGHERLLEVLHQYAPTWLVQMPALLNPTELEALQRKVLGATRERMLREIAEALEALTAERALILWLEDLHWSDYSTLDLLTSLARRLEKVQLLVIGSYRPVDLIVREHPLKTVKQELALHGHCAELALELLPQKAVEEYLAARFPGGVTGRSPLQQLAKLVHQRTEGNPLFMVAVTDAMVAQGVLVEREGQWELGAEVAEVEQGIPPNLHHFIEQQLARVNQEEQQVLEAGSAAGIEFSAAAVAAGLEKPVETIEKHCEGLARREQFLRAREIAEWPDGTVAARYGFLHALYHEVVYERVAAGHRISLHRKIGEREEAAYGPRAGEIAVELAVHFERGREYRKAVQYLEQAGKNALRRSAHVEAINHLARGLEVLKLLPDTPERTQQELSLQLTLSASLIATKGWTAPEAEAAYTRARELCRQVGETPRLFWVLVRRWEVNTTRAEHETARDLAEQLLRLTQSEHDPIFLVWAHLMLGETLLLLGELTPAREHLEQGIALYDPQKRYSYSTLHDLKVVCLSFESWAAWALGYADQALQSIHEALTLAQELSHPFSLAYALLFAAQLHQYRREVQAAQERAEALIVLASEQEFSAFLAAGTVHRGWALGQQGQAEGGIVQIRQGMAASQATMGEIGRPQLLARLAETYGKAGQIEEGLTVLAEALAAVQRTEERWYEAELYRLKGELTLQQWKVESGKSKVKSRKSEISNTQYPTPNTHEAEECFHKAIEIARKQTAKSLELRAVMSLSRLWQKQGKKKEARQMLAEIYGWFTEGFDTKDLQEAKALLESLSS